MALKHMLMLTNTGCSIVKRLDIAFVDRADIKMHIGLPSANAIYSMFIASLDELQRAGIIQPNVCFMLLTKIDAGTAICGLNAVAPFFFFITSR